MNYFKKERKFNKFHVLGWLIKLVGGVFICTILLFILTTFFCIYSVGKSVCDKGMKKTFEQIWEGPESVNESVNDIIND